MFDANLRHLAKDRKFFADVDWCNKGSILWEKGIRQGDVLFCTMMSKGKENPEILINFKGEEFTYSEKDDDELLSCWLVYAGTLLEKDDLLCGFIHKTSLDKAVAILVELDIKFLMGANPHAK